MTDTVTAAADLLTVEGLAEGGGGGIANLWLSELEEELAVAVCLTVIVGSFRAMVATVARKFIGGTSPL